MIDVMDGTIAYKLDYITTNEPELLRERINVKNQNNNSKN